MGVRQDKVEKNCNSANPYENDVFKKRLCESGRLARLAVKLVGTRSNRDGLRSIVSLTAGGLRQTLALNHNPSPG
jgi:hypothetical protein